MKVSYERRKEIKFSALPTDRHFIALREADQSKGLQSSNTKLEHYSNKYITKQSRIFKDSRWLLCIFIRLLYSRSDRRMKTRNTVAYDLLRHTFPKSQGAISELMYKNIPSGTATLLPATPFYSTQK